MIFVIPYAFSSVIKQLEAEQVKCCIFSVVKLENTFSCVLPKLRT